MAWLDELVQEAKPIFPVPNAQQYKQDHQAKLDALTKELDTLQHQHTARITQLKDDDKFYHQLMTSLNTCTNDTVPHSSPIHLSLFVSCSSFFRCDYRN